MLKTLLALVVLSSAAYATADESNTEQKSLDNQKTVSVLEELAKTRPSANLCNICSDCCMPKPNQVIEQESEDTETLQTCSTNDSSSENSDIATILNV